MSGLYLSKGIFPEAFFAPTVDYIRQVQLPSGAIPWFEDGYCDPWDHVESAMGLSIGGDFSNAERAYFWLAEKQLDDGSWWAAYKNDVVENSERRETNFVAYIATGVWHHYLISQRRDFLKRMWPTVEKAINFVVAQQQVEGDINWAVDCDGKPKHDALVTGCSSIYKSLECAHNIAVAMKLPRPEWLMAREKLGQALRTKPHRFDRTWESKSRYSMDWFYPVLTGVIPKSQASQHLQARWDEFVEQGMGCRCVSDEPWVTVAESCELTMALLAAGDHARAVEIYSYLHQWQLDDGSYWTGYQFVQDLLWPDEKPTWTAGAILLAADALTEHTAAAKLFTSVELLDASSDESMGNG